jgi:hypothetical protein
VPQPAGNGQQCGVAYGGLASQHATRTRKIFVGGLPPGVDEKLLRSHFEQYGTVEDSVVMYDHDNKRPRGFGFITFSEEAAVAAVFAVGNMQVIYDKQASVLRSVSGLGQDYLSLLLRTPREQ